MNSLVMFFLPLLLLLEACGDERRNCTQCGDRRGEPVVHAFDRCGRGYMRLCTEEEKVFIADMEAIAHKIRNNANTRDLRSDFHIFSTGVSSYDRKTKFFGEAHDKFVMQLANYSMMEQEFSSGDSILFEGAKPETTLDCTDTILVMLRCSLEWERSGKFYDPHEYADACLANQIMLHEVKGELQIPSLKMSRGQCRGWDEGSSHVSGASLQGQRIRNASLVETLNAEGHRHGQGTSYVVAGFRHSPIGDYYHWMRIYNNGSRSPWKPSLDAFYRHSTLRQGATTEEVHRFLQTRPTEYFSHKGLVENPDLLPPARG